MTGPGARERLAAAGLRMCDVVRMTQAAGDRRAPSLIRRTWEKAMQGPGEMPWAPAMLVAVLTAEPMARLVMVYKAGQSR